MAELPSISITNEMSDNDDDKTDNQIDYNIATDCENLESDSDCGAATKGNNLLTLKKKTHKTKKDALTDCEDFDASDSEETSMLTEDTHAITLEEFLDQGFINETTKFNGQNESMYDGPRKPSRCISPMPKSSLAVTTDASGLTDCEDLNDSGDDDISTECPAIEIALLMDENNTVESHDNVKSAMGQHHITTTDSSSSGESSGDEHTPFKSNRKHMVVTGSDTENVIFSDYEACLKSRPRKPVTTDLAEDEIIIVEMSDADEAGPSEMETSRCIGVHFKDTSQERHKPGTAEFSKLLAVLQDPSEGLTDVENLNSSDEEDDTPRYLSIPTAVACTDNAYLTDVEDVEGGESDAGEDAGIETNITLPKPVRQLIMVQETNTGAPQSRVVPLSDHLTIADDCGYQDKGLTDTEDLSDVNEELYDISEYLIDCVPDMEAGRITSSDKFVTKHLDLTRQTCDPLTDTEDITGVVDTRKKRHRHRNSNRQQKQRLFVNNDEAEGLTDVEELILSDQGNRRHSSNIGRHSESPLLTINNADDGGHTDVEILSEDDDAMSQCDRRMQRNSSPNILNKSDWFNSAEATKECLQEKGVKCKRHSLNMNLPRLRKLSPTPDAGKTDIEDLTGDDEADDIGFRGETPTAVHRNLDENSSTTHDRNMSVFNERSERFNIKGHQEVQETLTDTEVLEEERK